MFSGKTDGGIRRGGRDGGQPPGPVQIVRDRQGQADDVQRRQRRPDRQNRLHHMPRRRRNPPLRQSVVPAVGAAGHGLPSG